MKSIENLFMNVARLVVFIIAGILFMGILVIILNLPKHERVTYEKVYEVKKDKVHKKSTINTVPSVLKKLSDKNKALVRDKLKLVSKENAQVFINDLGVFIEKAHMDNISDSNAIENYSDVYFDKNPSKNKLIGNIESKVKIFMYCSILSILTLCFIMTIMLMAILAIERNTKKTSENQIIPL